MVDVVGHGSEQAMVSGPAGGRRRVALAMAALAVASCAVVLTPATRVAAAPVLQCNGASNTGGLTVNCNVVVVNTVTGDAGTDGSVVTVNGTTTSSDELVTSVDQCNGSANGGGGTLLCTVTVTNYVTTPGATTGPATVNQCNDNQDGDGLGNAPNTCVPYPATTTGADITQCNGSGNGGGLVSPSSCTATGTVSAASPVTINQCNGSANGGGARVICTAQVATILGPPPPTTTTTTPGGGGTTTTTPGGGGVTTTTPGGGGVTTTTVRRNVPGLPRTGPNDWLVPFAAVAMLVTAMGIVLVSIERRGVRR